MGTNWALRHDWIDAGRKITADRPGCGGLPRLCATGLRWAGMAVHRRFGSGANPPADHSRRWQTGGATKAPGLVVALVPEAIRPRIEAIFEHGAVEGASFKSSFQRVLDLPAEPLTDLGLVVRCRRAA
jgi:hypothetical protein